MYTYASVCASIGVGAGIFTHPRTRCCTHECGHMP